MNKANRIIYSTHAHTQHQKVMFPKKQQRKRKKKEEKPAKSSVVHLALQWSNLQFAEASLDIVCTEG